MSSVSTVGNGNDLLTYLQQLAAQNLQQQNTNPTTAASPAKDSDGDTAGSSSTSTSGVTGQAGHHGGGHHHAISSQLQNAITTVLGSANGSTDPNQVIQTAIENFLKSSSTTGSTSGTPTATADGQSPTSPATITDPTNPQSTFAQLLQSNGVSPSQFRQDLSSALQDSQSQGTSIDFAQVFKNFPPGTTIDTTA